MLSDFLSPNRVPSNFFTRLGDYLSLYYDVLIQSVWFIAIPASFWAPNTGVAGAIEEMKMLQGQIDGRRAAVLHAAEIWAAAEPQEADSSKI